MFRILACITAATLVLYGLSALHQAPPSGPEGFIPNSLENAPRPGSLLARLSPVFVLLYAFSFLPVVVLFAATMFRANPCGVILGACLVVTSLLIEILTALPLSTLLLAPPQATTVPRETLLYLMQSDAIRFLSLDVAGFTLAYLGVSVLAWVFRRQDPWLARLTTASILLFAANVPFLWVRPGVAVVLMVLSVAAFAVIPLRLAKHALLAATHPGIASA